jgi:hypothetical protein
MWDNANTWVLAFHDIRWNSWRWRPILERWGYLKVFASDRVLKTATFVAFDDEPIATVFFVRVRLGELAWYAHYAITAYHCVNDRVVSILFNTNTEIDPQHFCFNEWVCDRENDIAVLPIDDVLKSNYDIEWIDLEHFAFDRTNLNDPSTQQSGIHTSFDRPYGAGNEIFSIGLFQGHRGCRLTQPVARFGHIAMQPPAGEKVMAEIEPNEWKPIDGFLAEMAAWKGQSGSPVFHHRTGLEFLVGMLQGFYPGEQEVKINNEPFTLSSLLLGIGVIVPAQTISEFLMTNKKLKEHQADLHQKKKRDLPLKPRAASHELKETGQLTKRSFHDMLKRVSQKVSEPESKDSETSE